MLACFCQCSNDSNCSICMYILWHFSNLVVFIWARKRYLKIRIRNKKINEGWLSKKHRKVDLPFLRVNIYVCKLVYFSIFILSISFWTKKYAGFRSMLNIHYFLNWKQLVLCLLHFRIWNEKRLQKDESTLFLQQCLKDMSNGTCFVVRE